MRKITLLLVSLLFAGAQMLQAQRTITGKVVDAGTKETIPMANVKVAGTSTGTVTDMNGQYSLNVPANATHLEFTYTGMATQTIEIGSKTVIDVSMETTATAIEGVEIVGYGTARKVGNTVGSVQQVSSQKLEAKPVANVLDALQGQVAGLQVFTSSGEPGTTQSMTLHGVGSLGASSTPLYIVDGVQVDPGTIVALNANDFESVTVLKDASATSIYGARAANGVVVITTKRGIRNTNAKVIVRSQYGISKLAERRFFDNVMNTGEYVRFWESVGNTGLTEALLRESPVNINPETGQLWDTRWVDVFMKENVPTFQNDVSVQGGSEKTTYFISGSQFNQEGTAHGSYYDRYTIRMNVESDAKDWLKVGMNTAFSRDNRRSNGNWGSNYTYGGLSMLHRPYYSPFDQNMNVKDLLYSGVDHPEYYARKVVSNATNSQLNGNFFVAIEPIKNLKFITRSGVDAFDYASIYTRYPSYQGAPNNGQAQESSQQGITMTTNNVVEYTFDVDEIHHFTALLGHEGILNNVRQFGAGGSGLILDDFMLLADVSENGRAVSSGQSSYAFLSFFARAEYNYNDKFFFDATLRNDASSRFGKNNRNAQFWSLGGMWNMTNEEFVKDLGFLTDARFHVSYGTQGNAEIGNYESHGLTTSAGLYNNVGGIIMATPGNPNLTWEKQNKFTVGIRGEINRKYRFELDFYRRATQAMLIDVPFPATVGYSALLQNIGSLMNSGVDLNLSADFLRTRDYFLSANIVFNYNKSKITELFNGFERYEITNTGIAYVVGEPIMYYYPIYAGVDPADGQQMWYLPGDDIDVTTKGATTKEFDEIALSQNTGKLRYAPFSGGFGVQGGWKGIQVSADFAYVIGKWMIDNTSFFTKNPKAFTGYNQSRDIMDYWTPQNPNAEYPNWNLTGSQTQYMQFDTHLLSNASFLRLKNLTVSYSLPKTWLNKVQFITNVRVFYTGRNLMTITKFTGIDPEVNSNISMGSYVNSKQHQVGLEVIF